MTLQTLPRVSSRTKFTDPPLEQRFDTLLLVDARMPVFQSSPALSQGPLTVL
jgi:hypothetical protein